MKKGVKLSAYNYKLEISNLSRKPIFTSGGTSLRELIGLVSDFVPSMDSHSKVYREMRENLGAYMGLFVVSGKKKPRHVVVTITTDVVSEVDFARFYAQFEGMPETKLPDCL